MVGVSCSHVCNRVRTAVTWPQQSDPPSVLPPSLQMGNRLLPSVYGRLCVSGRQKPENSSSMEGRRSLLLGLILAACIHGYAAQKEGGCDYVAAIEHSSTERILCLYTDITSPQNPRKDPPTTEIHAHTYIHTHTQPYEAYGSNFCLFFTLNIYGVLLLTIHTVVFAAQHANK